MMRGITGSTTGSTTGSRELPVVPPQRCAPQLASDRPPGGVVSLSRGQCRPTRDSGSAACEDTSRLLRSAFSRYSRFMLLRAYRRLLCSWQSWHTNTPRALDNDGTHTPAIAATSS